MKEFFICTKKPKRRMKMNLTVSFVKNRGGWEHLLLINLLLDPLLLLLECLDLLPNLSIVHLSVLLPVIHRVIITFRVHFKFYR